MMDRLAHLVRVGVRARVGVRVRVRVRVRSSLIDRVAHLIG